MVSFVTLPLISGGSTTTVNSGANKKNKIKPQILWTSKQKYYAPDTFTYN